MDPALIMGDKLLTIAQVLNPPSSDIPFKSGPLDVSENGSDFREHTCVLRYDRFYCIEQNPNDKYPNIMIHMTEWKDNGRRRYNEDSGFKLPYKKKHLFFKARSLADGQDWVVRLWSMKYLKYRFVTISGCSTLVANWHNFPSDPIMLAKQLEVKQVGVTNNYLKGMHEKDFWKFPSRYGCKWMKKPETSFNNNILEMKQKKSFRNTNLRAIKRMTKGKRMKFLSRKRLEKLISKSRIIKHLNIPITVVKCIVLFAEVTTLPISYSVLYLPLFCRDAFGCDKTYSATLQRWWRETVSLPGHRGVFLPSNPAKAAEEFSLFIAQKLRDNGLQCKYFNSMIPSVYILPSNLTSYRFPDLDKFSMDSKNTKIDLYGSGISLCLPTAFSECLGGKELFQRLYLEAMLYSQISAFTVDINKITQSHGDNWCFDGNGLVLMADSTRKKVSKLLVGDRVMCFGGRKATVECCIASQIGRETKMCNLQSDVGGCWITFEHPVLFSSTQRSSYFDANGICMYNLDSLDTDKIAKYALSWELPMDLYPTELRFQGYVYNFILNAHHTLNVEGHWCATLGHNYRGRNIEHEFWGNNAKLRAYLRSNSNTYPYVMF